MRAVEISEAGGPEVLTLVDRDSPEPAAGQVRIKVLAAGVNRPDCFQRAGLYPPPPGASDLPGLEVSGWVDALGPETSGFALGQSVAALTPGGGYAEYVVADAGSVLPAPEGVPLADAAGIMETAMTVWSNLFMRAGAKAGESLLVHGGSSGIGATTIQFAKAFGLTVFTTVGSQEKADFVRSLGADHVIQYRQDDFVDRIRQATEGAGVDVILDMVGGDYVPRNIKSLAVGGRHVSIALLRGPRAEVDFGAVMRRRLTLTGSTLRPQSDRFKAKVAAQLRDHIWPLYAAGQIKVPVDSWYGLEDAGQAHARMEGGTHMGKILLKVGEAL